MLSNDGKTALCDVAGCGNAAVAGCELRIDAGHGGDHVTMLGDLIAWCESHEQNFFGSMRDEYILLDLEAYNSLTFRSNGASHMAIGRIIVYQYFGETSSHELEIDLTGELHFSKGEIIVRGGKNWKINGIRIEEPIKTTQRPTLWLELVPAPVN